MAEPAGEEETGRWSDGGYARFVYVSANCSCCLGFLTIIKIQTASGEAVYREREREDEAAAVNVAATAFPGTGCVPFCLLPACLVSY